MLYRDRDKFKSTQKKIGSLFAKLPFSANTYTLLASLCSLFSVWLVFTNNLIPAIIFYGIAFFLDIIDGAVARAKNQVSNLGAFYDTVSDKYTEFFFIAGYAFLPAPSFILLKNQWLVLYAGSYLLSGYIKAAAVEKKAIPIEMKGGGLMERPERVILLFLLFLVYLYSPLYSVYILVLMTILAHITAYQRFRIVQKAFHKSF